MSKLDDHGIHVTVGARSNAAVLAACWDVMSRNNLKPFDRDGNRHFYWFISKELVEHEWMADVRNEIGGIPVLLAPRGGSFVELLRWVDGAQIPHGSASASAPQEGTEADNDAQ